MIIGETHDTTDQALSYIRTSRFQFYPTGSRYFGGAGTDSDWDFFTESSPETQEVLRQVGFTVAVDNAEATGLQEVDSIWRMGNVYVQLVVDAAMKQRLQVVLRADEYFVKANTLERKRLWKLAYACAKAATPEQPEEKSDNTAVIRPYQRYCEERYRWQRKWDD